MPEQRPTPDERETLQELVEIAALGAVAIACGAGAGLCRRARQPKESNRNSGDDETSGVQQQEHRT